MRGGILILILLSLLSTTAVAQLSITNAQAINISGKQRMLTQRMGKSFVYLTQGVNKGVAESQKNKSIILFEEGLRILNRYSPNSEITTKIDTVEVLWVYYKSILESDYTDENGKIVISTNSKILSACNDVVMAIEDYTKKTLLEENKSNTDQQLAKTINISGRQRMLSQRFTLYYMAYHSRYNTNWKKLQGVHDLFDESLTWLIASSYNNGSIDDNLVDVLALWKKVRDDLSALKSKEVDPRELYSDMDKIMSVMNTITGQYASLKAL